MSTARELLKEHTLYGLDQTIVNYLTPLLERRFGDRFLHLRALEEARAAEALEETVQLAPTLVGQELALQEDILGPGLYTAELNEAWHALMDAAPDGWKDLCKLYCSVLIDLRDLERMATALWAAQRIGNDAHTQQVRRILNLDATVAPNWAANN